MDIGATQTIQAGYSLEVIDPCAKTEWYSKVSYSLLENDVSDIYLPSPAFASISVLKPTDTVSLNFGSTRDGYTFCGPRTLTVYNQTSAANLDLAKNSEVSVEDSVLLFRP